MKKFSFLVLLVLSVFSANVFAESEVDVWGGYARFGFDKKVDKSFSIIDSLSDESDEHVTKRKIKGMLDRAFTVGVDYYFGNGENVKPGFRVAYSQSCDTKKISVGSVNGDDAYVSIMASLGSVMPGIRLNYDINEKFSLNGKLFAGIAMTSYNIGVDLSGKTNDLVAIGGCRFAADVSIGAQYLFTEKFGLGLDLGYRPFPSDLSGFTAKLGLNFKI
ncbi:hypothetical protein AGMMS50222_03020 [Endomicrobiia bacterium]|nr:hypothetical protein AGMMS49556_01070 [Endomicrobiia bacterium]GHT74228.1 hypothetical protein AGMMS50222_03020 [Endomicrobiia bacterium]